MDVGPHEDRTLYLNFIASEQKNSRLHSRPGNHLTDRFPLIVEALRRLGARSCIVDGEAVACGEDGIASFERMRDTPCASLHPKAYWTKVSPVDRCETTRT
jgi:ATP-dependent DNA ligase